MKKVKLILGLAVMLSLLFTSCNNEDDSIEVNTQEEVSDDNEIIDDTLDIITGTIENLHAEQTKIYDTSTDPVTRSIGGEFTRFSFAEDGTVTSDDWDIAFRGTTVLVNGGTYTGLYTSEPERTGEASLVLEAGAFSEIVKAPSDADFNQDAEGVLALTTGSGNGWYTYDSSTHIISAIAGKVLVVKTVNGNYAKVEFLSYNKDYDTSSDVQYYSFNYTYNTIVGDTSLE